jgi:chondroitin sulfate synthase
VDKYDWFIRVDDDLHLQFDHLIQFLSKIDPDEPHYIGGTGFGRNADDYIPHGTAFCMGGSGVLFSHALVTKLRPYLTTCIKVQFSNSVTTIYIFCFQFFLGIYFSNFSI